MVATRLTLLSLAAVSSCMFGAFQREHRAGRLERRIEESSPPSTQSVTDYLGPAVLVTGSATTTDYQPAPASLQFTSATIPAVVASPGKPPIVPEPISPVVAEPYVPGVTGSASPARLPPQLPATTTYRNASGPGPRPFTNESNPDSPPTLTSILLPSSPSITFGEWVTISFVTQTLPVPTGNVTYCQASDHVKRQTEYVIVQSTTITWMGDPDDYTPPYPPATTPPPCQDPPAADPISYTLSRCNGTGTITQYVTCEYTTTVVEPVSSNYPEPKIPATTVLITDKNPAVLYWSTQLPDYGGGGQADTMYKDKQTASPTSSNSRGGRTAAAATTRPPVTLSVSPGTVVINDQTYTDSPASETQVAHVGGQDFTIEPSRVVGAGSTISRPPPTAAPTTTAFEGVPVVISSNVAVVGGTTFDLDGPPTTQVVQDKTVSIGEAGVAIVGQAGTTRFSSPQPRRTDVVVAGGEMVTAIGQSVLVIYGTTITYGPSVPQTTILVNGEQVTVGAAGVSFRGTTIGGLSARESETAYEVVGGATITQVAPSKVIIDGSTYTAGPGSPRTTFVVGGQTVTVGPEGVVVSTMTFSYPFGHSSTVVTITPGPTATAVAATQTASSTRGSSSGGTASDASGDAKEDVAAGLRPLGQNSNFNLFYIVSGVLVWVLL